MATPESPSIILTDAKGRVVDFKNTIVILTSNIGARAIEKGQSLGFATGGEENKYRKMKDVVMDELKNNFRPEFINRIDEIIVFHPLTQDEITTIVDVMLAEVRNRLKEQEYDLELTPEVHAMLAKEGYNPSYGARPLRRAIQRLIEDPLAEEILAGALRKGVIIAKQDGEKVVFGMKEEPEAGPQEVAKTGV